jgi:hypothetical protein
VENIACLLSACSSASIITIRVDKFYPTYESNTN